jgi:hypothetical protein
MIPIIHQGLHILALGSRGPTEDRSDAPAFRAALAAQEDNPSPPAAAVSAESCLAAGMVMPAQPILQTQPIVATKMEAAEPILPAPPISIPNPAAAYPTEASPSALASASTVPQTTPIFTTVPLVLTPKNQPQPVSFGAVEIPATSIPKPELPLATGKASLPITPPEKPRDIGPALAITRFINDPAPIPTLTPTSQNASALARSSIAAPAGIIAKTSVANAVLAPQIPAAELRIPAQTADQRSDKAARTNHAAMTLAPLCAEPNDPPPQAFPLHVLPVQTQPDQTSGDHTQDAPQSPLPEQKPSISPAESAWQTRLQVAVPMGDHAKPNIAPIHSRIDAAPATADYPSSATPSPAPDSIDLKLFVPPSPPANVAPIPQAADSPAPQPPKADPAPAQHPVAPTSAQLSPAITPKPTADAAIPLNLPAAPPDQATLQPTPDQVNQQATPASAQPNPPHQTVQPKALPPALATAVPAHLLHHTAAAKTGGVEVLLQPEELGHVRFQILQHGETVRILLSAERPETLDLLRRHSDQLLQEFRQSGFTQASLNFGQWGQHQRSPPPPPELVAVFDADFVEAPPMPRPPSTAAVAPTGQGLNLRL